MAINILTVLIASIWMIIIVLCLIPTRPNRSADLEDKRR